MTAVSRAERRKAQTSPPLLRDIERISLVFVVLTGATVAGALVLDGERFLPVYLTGFAYLLTLGLGGVFSLLLHYVTSARWSAPLVRPLGAMARLVFWCAPLFLPVAFGARELVSAFAVEHQAGANAEPWARYHSLPLLLGRSAVYWLVWGAVVAVFRESSRNAARDGSGALRRWRLGRASGPALALLGLTLTLAGFDWFSPAAPRWYSAAIGVRLFAGAMTSSLALIALLVLAMPTTRSPEHALELRHDVGKLLFGFTVFWAYITFTEYLITWYAGRPAGGAFYAVRLSSHWQPVTIALVLLHFVLPSVTLLSKAGKRSSLGLAAASVMLLVGHGFDIAWILLPGEGEFASPSPWGVIGLSVFCVALPLHVLSSGVSRGCGANSPATTSLGQRSRSISMPEES